MTIRRFGAKAGPLDGCWRRQRRLTGGIRLLATTADITLYANECLWVETKFAVSRHLGAAGLPVSVVTLYLIMT